MALYKGAPGNSTLVRNQFVFDGTYFPTLVKVQNAVSFSTLGVQDEDEFFGVIFPSGPLNDARNRYPDLEQFNAYFTNGSVAPPHQNFHILKWKWGPKPPSEYDPVVIIPGILGSWEKNGQWVLDPILHTYDNLVDTFLANGYVENQTLFRFPYDWKNSNVLTAQLLGNKIDEIKDICNCERVDLIGHSMGGLVAGQYIASDEYANDVDQVAFVATPFAGAPKAYKTWEGGEFDFGRPINNFIMRVIFKNEARENGYNNIFEYIRGKPIISIAELLPVYTNYLRTSTTTLQYPVGYPQNPFLENLVQKIDFVLYNSGISPFTILADTASNETLIEIVIQPSNQLPKWQHGEPVQSVLGAGDLTVPRWSIENIVGTADKELYAVDHTLAASSSIPHVFRFLNDRSPDSLVGKIYSPNIPFLIIQLLSPIDMQVVAPDGKRLGKDFSNNIELNEISDAFYSGFAGNNEYAVIVDPIPGTYGIKTAGTGSGFYTIVADYINTSGITEAEVTGTTEQGRSISHTLTLSSTTAEVTLVKDEPPPPPVDVTPDSCVKDMQLAYQNKWITKKAVYNALVADCKLLKVLFAKRDKAKSNLIRKGILVTIRLTLDHMDKLAKDKSNTKEAVELITKNTIWFREHEL